VRPERAMRLVRGSHIVVRKLFDHSFAYFFQLPDGRIFFAIPYERDFTLIGTTDVDHHGGPIEASAEEIAYLCEGASRFFRKAVKPADVVWTYSGVRPLVDDGSGRPEAATRGYELDLSDEDEGAALLSVYGGKITTYRHLAQEAVDMLAPRLGLSDGAWTASAALPGGDFAVGAEAALEGRFSQRFPFLADHAHRLVRAYGTTAFEIFAGAGTLGGCGRDFGHGLSEREVRHLVTREWARSADDVLWRRTKLGLRFAPDEAMALEEFIGQECTP
jgi:glycerol-3-phosphate dehydrogenase